MARVLACAAGCPCAPASASPAPTWAAFTCGRANCPGIILRSSSGDSPAFSWCPASPRSACCFGGSSRASRLEGIFPAALLPLLLTMILFLGPLMQLSMDCPWDLADGLKVALAPQAWARCLTDMRWLRNQVIAPLTEELVFRACMLPMLAPCTGLGPAIFTCPLFFGVGQRGEHLLVSCVSVLLHGGLWGLHGFPLHPHRTPDRTSPLSLFLQLHGLPRGVCSPGAPPEVPPAGGLCLGGGALSAPAAAPHGAQTVQQPPPLPAPGPNRRVSHFAVLLTSAPSLQTLTGSPAPHEKWGEG
ncbi:CAAX prenyl protease 2 isoform X5 [Vombatus ursinus]|uniref:CAAX prenyl protease 2 isoform X5 n=1 Tax=Vombatus ursinus TaxID=29139 RepID=UPI000FFD6F03|nr:CAAX prenyl protease 2 isoform X5 [Vombatus ursinus]